VASSDGLKEEPPSPGFFTPPDPEPTTSWMLHANAVVVKLLLSLAER
jgi:hypothetical protein